MIDEEIAPGGLEHAVGEPEDGDILDCFLTQVMIDPINLILRQHALNVGIQRLGRGEIPTEWFSIITLRQTFSFSLVKPASPREWTMGPKKLGAVAR